MLKLKDEVDFKELQKYFFSEGDDGWYYWSGKNGYGIRKMGIAKMSRLFKFNGISIPVLDVIYDMITDGILEKVANEDYRCTKNELVERVAELEERIRKLES